MVHWNMERDWGFMSRMGGGCVAVVLVCVWGCGLAFGAGDANQSSCSQFGSVVEGSPGFRAALPDCRAFELVTPPYTEDPAYPVGVEPAFGVSPDGNHVLVESFSGLAHTENDEQFRAGELGGIYEASRSASGWIPEALDPPASLYPRSAYKGASADLSRVLWGVTVASSVGEERSPYKYEENNNEILVVREAAGGGKGRFTTVGPLAAPGHELLPLNGVGEPLAVGFSEDLSDVFLDIPTNAHQTWPGDQTMEGTSSLYEYHGGLKEPELVGVSNVGALAGGVHVNEHAKLISTCGTQLGSPDTLYNAVSRSGEVAYFTADQCVGGPPVNELYARVGNARTVAISEPSVADCAACNISVPSEAKFQGASQDGSVVFFTTTQGLLAGGEGSSLYEYDFRRPEGARVRLVAPDVPAVARVSEDGSRVYFESTALLTAVANGTGEKAQNGAYNLYVYSTATAATSFVADLMSKEEAGGRSLPEVEAFTGLTALDASRPLDTTVDGRCLVFYSTRHLTGAEDQSTVKQLFEYDAQTGALVRVSVGAKSPSGYECPETHVFEPGYGCNGNTMNPNDTPEIVHTPDYNQRAFADASTGGVSVTSTGAVIFESRDRLTPLAVAEAENVYEYEAGQLYLISPGDEAAPLTIANRSRLLGSDESGQDVFFESADSLVPQQSGSQEGWFDARAGGGFPGLTSPGGCGQGSCQGPLAPAPPLPSAGGSAAMGGEKLASPVSSPPAKQVVLSGGQRLARALKVCRRQRKGRRRVVCEERARRSSVSRGGGRS